MPLKVEDGYPIVPNRPAADQAARGREVLAGVACVGQEQTLWCWAAVLQMILRYHGDRTVRQCDLPSTLWQDKCCATPTAGDCPRAASAQQQLDVLQKKHRNGELVDGHIPFGDVQQEIGDRRPVAVGTRTAGGGHRILVRGWDDHLGPRLIVCDPLYGHGVVLHADLVSGAGGRTWYATLIKIK